MDDIKNIIDNMISFKEQIEQKIYKYMYITNNKVELEKAIADDKEFISRMQSLLGEKNKNISTSDNKFILNDNISMPSLDAVIEDSLPALEENKNENIDNSFNVENENTNEENELPALEVIDLGVGNIKEEDKEPKIVDELQELTSSSQSSEVWTPPEISSTEINQEKNINNEDEKSIDLKVEEQPQIIPEAKTPTNNDYKPSEDLNGVSALNTNKFIMPEFMNDSLQTL